MAKVKTSDGKSSLSIPCSLDLRTHRFALSNLARDRWVVVGGDVGEHQLRPDVFVFLILFGGVKNGLKPSLKIEFGNAENGWLEDDRFLLVWLPGR